MSSIYGVGLLITTSKLSSTAVGIPNTSPLGLIPCNSTFSIVTLLRNSLS
ncbi:MAG: hypothetical protein QXL51_03745 [Candidatus Aenigmatarchaeota archaeon]